MVEAKVQISEVLNAAIIGEINVLLKQEFDEHEEMKEELEKLRMRVKPKILGAAGIRLMQKTISKLSRKSMRLLAGRCSPEDWTSTWMHSNLTLAKALLVLTRR